ncbi:unnamed protein product [Rangifer tarandus platyrhynchus]|uniref:Uncharacterized protein n=2 Tax=Rangifer tarandus platyrhynchus TaxID=3082113 RepID=A0ABN9A0E0_RANTA|nr:unnamed protein product [Rangifer tarandus platyrhynchus]CAI9713675.1 unnamed protein product [Rangifer tarandus platyrhynchus]
MHSSDREETRTLVLLCSLHRGRPTPRLPHSEVRPERQSEAAQDLTKPPSNAFWSPARVTLGLQPAADDSFAGMGSVLQLKNKSAPAETREENKCNFPKKTLTREKATGESGRCARRRPDPGLRGGASLRPPRRPAGRGRGGPALAPARPASAREKARLRGGPRSPPAAGRGARPRSLQPVTPPRDSRGQRAGAGRPPSRPLPGGATHAPPRSPATPRPSPRRDPSRGAGRARPYLAEAGACHRGPLRAGSSPPTAPSAPAGGF